MRPLFAEAYSNERGWFIDELLNEEPRKTGWMRAEAAGDPGPYRKQELLGRDRWTQTSQRDLVRRPSVSVMKARCWPSEQHVVRSGATIHRLGRKDHELSGGGVRDLCVASRGHGPRALSAEELNGRPASPESRACARRCRLFEEAATCREDDCARHCSARSVRLGCGRQSTACRLHRSKQSYPGSNQWVQLL
jgi:hypothetical protein